VQLQRVLVLSESAMACGAAGPGSYAQQRCLSQIGGLGQDQLYVRSPEVDPSSGGATWMVEGQSMHGRRAVSFLRRTRRREKACCERGCHVTASAQRASLAPSTARQADATDHYWTSAR
jgi:hypothetical protein